MTLEKAIEKVCGVTLEDMRSDVRSLDRLYGRAIYSVLSGKKRTEVAKDLNKCFTTITYYKEKYYALCMEDSEFEEMANKISSML